MRFLPHTPDDVRTMLDVVGVSNVADLFTDIPATLRASATIDLPAGLPELEVRRRMEELAARNRAAQGRCFLGAGAYPHFIPAVVDQILQRAEFYSAYTPYQPEVSQGTLQAIFEFQTLVAMLLDMEVANASMYDGASATAEAVLMAARLRPKRRRVLVSRALHPQYRQVICSYVDGCGEVEIIEVPFAADGRTDCDWLSKNIDEQTAAVLVGYPNFFGVAEDLGTIATLAHGKDALLITATAEPLALGILKAPGSYGADIAVAEGQSLGIPVSYGGPGVGLFATRNQFVRTMPGRLAGEAYDGAGRRGYVLTLATREQHIRREKATSNICTNQGLMSLAFTVHVSTLGKSGLHRLAVANTAAAHQVAQDLKQVGCKQVFDGPFFNEVVITKPGAKERWDKACATDLIAGLPLERWYPELKDALLLCVTEVHDEAARRQLVEALR